MNIHTSILDKINPGYFWDINKSKLSEVRSKRLIIERVFSLGTITEINYLIKFYGKNEVVKIIKSINYLDPKTFNFAVKLFNQPKKEFACYSRKQSTPQLWNS